MVRTIKRELDITDPVEQQYLLDNMSYRHNLYNKGVEIIRELKKFDDSCKLSGYTIDPILHSVYDKNLPNYNYYCTGIRAEVCADLQNLLLWAERNGKKYKTVNEKYKMHQFKRYHRTFRFNTWLDTNKDGTMYSKIKDLTDRTIRISFGKNNEREYKIKEKSWNNRKNGYLFGMYDIVQVSFVYRNKRFFICLTANVEPINKHNKRRRLDLAGIDLGERNPAMIYDGEDHVKIKFPYYNKKDNNDKMQRLDARINSLRAILNRKQKYSKNYNKVLLKMNRLYRRQYYIRLDWRNKRCYSIVNTFKTIIVDSFKVPIIPKGDKYTCGISKDRQRDINRKMYSIGMSYFASTLRAMADKYDCQYIDAAPNTTRKCSICGHLNKPLNLSEKYMVCENPKCCAVIHRDKNASKNCYMQYYKYILNI